MTNNNFKIKALLGFINLLFFPFGLIFDFTKYTNIAAIFALAIIIGSISLFLTLPYIKRVFNLDEKENYID